MTHNIEVESGKSVKLPTAGKYCDRDIVVAGFGSNEAELRAKYDEGKADGIAEGKQAEHAVMDSILTNRNIGHYYNDTVDYLTAHAFNSRSSILSINMPNVTRINMSVFASCSKMTEAHLPNLTECSNTGQFTNCTVLEFVDLGSVNTFSTSMFLNCAALKTIVIRRTSGVPSIQNINAFNGTPYANGGSGGKIYVPSALIESYKTATNWSALYGYGTVEFVPLEGSKYE